MSYRFPSRSTLSWLPPPCVSGPFGEAYAGELPMATFTTKNGDIETTAEEHPNGGVTITSKNTAGKPLTKDNLAVKGGFKDDGSYQITVTPNPAPAEKSKD